MTDYPRFQTIASDPDCRHLHYHGGPMVDLTLRATNAWLARNRSAWPSLYIWRRSQRQWGAVAVAVLLLLTGVVQVLAQESVRIPGTIEEAVDGVYAIRTRDDKRVRLKLSANASVAASVKSSLADIRPGLYIGVAAAPRADGSLRALEAHIFDETMRGTAEGHRAWDLVPKSTMTNAVVQEIVSAVEGHAVTLRYKDGLQRITIPPATTITYLPGSVSELKSGAAIFVPGAATQPDGTLVAQRVMVGRDIAPPQ